MSHRIQTRRDTAANWTSNNPTLSLGEIGFETDTEKYKIGDGSTAWNSLDYQDKYYIHTNVAGEISGLSEKTSPASTDIIMIEDSADSNNKKKAQITNLATGTDSTAIHDNVASEISAIAEKSSPVDADLIIIEDSADSNNKKKVQLGNLQITPVFGSAYTSTSSTDESSHSSTSDSTKVTHSVTSPPSGDYETMITGEYKSDGSGTCMVTITSPGSTTDLQVANSTANYKTFTLMVKYTASTTFSYLVKWKRSAGSGTVYIKNVRCRSFRVS